MDQQTNEQIKDAIVKLSQHLSNECQGVPMLIVQGALGHLLAQLIMHGTKTQRDAHKRIDAMAKAMKDDIRVIWKSKQN